MFACRCHWVDPLWLLSSYLEVSFRFREWSSLHSRPSFSPLTARQPRWDQPFLMLQLMHINNPVFCFQAAGSDSEDSQDSSDSGAATQKTREILARRPSYRWRPQEKTKRTNSSLSLTLMCGSSTPVEKSWTTCRLKRWRMPRGRTTVQLPQALLYPRLPSTRPAPASTVRPPVCHSNRTGSASTTTWPLIVHILLSPVWWSQLL